MNRKKPKLVILIAIILTLFGVFSIISSIPLYNVETALYRGGIENKVAVTVQDAMPNTPAAFAGFVSGDKIISTNGKPISSTADFISIIHNSLGTPVSIVVERNGIQQTIMVTPRTTYPPTQGPLGVAIREFDISREPA